MSEAGKIITRICRPEEVIFRQGDAGRHLYLILSGLVEIYKTIDGSRQSISRFGSGEIFGEMGVLTNEPRCATAIAIEETRLIMVDECIFHNALGNNKLPILKPLTRQLVQRLQETEAMLQESRLRVSQLEQQLTGSCSPCSDDGRRSGS
ncbi:MAG: cyclic nucleotide-binding domain-containing protein [Desulfofustis sp.]|nr:cyclic nucleotide-binding domain-containing protein [Desulfofustis sp.]